MRERRSVPRPNLDSPALASKLPSDEYQQEIRDLPEMVIERPLSDRESTRAGTPTR
jgi:hypothetical protein